MRFRKFLKPYKTRGSSFREHTFMVGGRRNHQGRTDKCRCLINEKIPTLLMEWGISVLGGSDEY